MSYDWEYGLLRDELRETKSLTVGISRGLRDVQQSLKANGLRSPGKAKPEARPGRILLKAAVSELLRPISYSSGGAVTFTKYAAEMARSLYAGDERLQDWIKRAAVSPATTTGVGYAAELVSTATIDFLSGDDAASGFSALAAQTLNVPVEGNVKVPARAHPATLTGSWTVENAKPVFALSLTSITLTANKITAISAWTDEIEQWSTPAIEAVVADSLRRDINAVLDTTAFGTAAAVSAAPAGLFNGATSVTASTATPLSEAMLADLGALQAAVATGAPDARPVFIMNGKQGLRFRMQAPDTGDVIISNFMSPGSVGAIDANSVVTMMGPLTFLSSNNATLHLSDTPLPLGTPGAPATIASPVSSAFQQNLVALRSTLHCGWKVRRSGAAALATGVTW